MVRQRISDILEASQLVAHLHTLDILHRFGFTDIVRVTSSKAGLLGTSHIEPTGDTIVILVQNGRGGVVNLQLVDGERGSHGILDDHTSRIKVCRIGKVILGEALVSFGGFSLFHRSSL